MNEKTFVVGEDGHVLSEKELEEARRLDEPVSTGDAPGTRAETTLAIEIDGARGMIEMFTQRIERWHEGPGSENYHKREYAKRRLAKLEANFLAPIQPAQEAERWKTYLEKSETAGVSGHSTGVRAAELAATLGRESLTVQRVARWRRNFPAGRLPALREWLTDDQIRDAVARLKALDMLKGKQLVIG